MEKKEKQGRIIRVSDEVMEYIEAHGNYKDTPDSILRRRLGLPAKKGAKG